MSESGSYFKRLNSNSNNYYPFFTGSSQIKLRWQSLLLSALQSTALYMPHSQKWQKDTAFQQPTPTTIIPFPPAQKGSAHQVTNELWVVTSFSEAGLSFPDQYLKLKSSSVSQPFLLLCDFVAQTWAAAGSSHTAGSEISHLADKIAWKQSRDSTFWLNQSLIILVTSPRQ